MSHALPAGANSRGNLDLLQTQTLAFFCSVKCPGSLILQVYDYARALQQTRVTVIGGFHSPMEKECLTLLLRGSGPLIICPARSIEGMRIPPAWKDALDAHRLLLLSPFGTGVKRTTEATAGERNRFVAKVADEVFVAHAAPGGKTEDFCREILDGGKALKTLESPYNAHLIALGAEAVKVQ